MDIKRWTQINRLNKFWNSLHTNHFKKLPSTNYYWGLIFKTMKNNYDYNNECITANWAQFKASINLLLLKKRNHLFCCNLVQTQWVDTQYFLSEWKCFFVYSLIYNTFFIKIHLWFKEIVTVAVYILLLEWSKDFTKITYMKQTVDFQQ